MNTLNPADFGFTTSAFHSKDGYPTRLQYATTEPDVPTINEVILWTRDNGNAVLAIRAEMGSDNQNLTTVAEIRFAFNDQDRLLMAASNPAFFEAAFWELICKAPEEVANTLMATPDLQETTKAFQLATGHSTDPDMNLDLTYYQMGQLVFAMMGATMIDSE